MLGNAPYTFKTIEKITCAFGWIFQDISIQRKDPVTSAIKTIKVPIELSTKDKWAQRAISDPNAGNEPTQKHVQIVLPRMAYEMTGFRYDAKRKLSPIMFRVAAADTNKTLKKQLNPVPMIFEFALYIQTRTLEDGYAILEQFIPFFQPDYTVPILDIPELQLEKDIIFSLINNTHQDTFEGNFLDKRIIEWQFDFEARGHIYPPVREKKIITEADVNVHDYTYLGGYDTVASTIVPDDANVDDSFTIKEEVK